MAPMMSQTMSDSIMTILLIARRRGIPRSPPSEPERLACSLRRRSPSIYLK
jgi:hypothetical protein